MREGGIVRAEGGGGHGDHVTTLRGVCERDKERMNMIRKDKAQYIPWRYLPQSLMCMCHMHISQR